jgi:riboflavin kinase/FMN adenylyltransferase
MQIHSDIIHLPAFRNAVVTIGTFDGVHLGHRTIIRQLVSESRRVDGESVIITFHPHPRKVVRENADKTELLTSVEERALLMGELGVDNLVVVPFTREFSEQSPEEYIQSFLYERFKPKVVIIGYDHRFGKERAGDYKLLEEYSAKGLFDLKEISQQVIAESAISSTRIRQALKHGDVMLANELLGYDFFFEGIVTRGDQRGRTIGFPTANLQIMSEDKLVPANGVYAVQVQKIEPGSSKALSKGMMNIGVRPTVDGTKKTIEVHLFDFDGDLYGTKLRVHLKRFLRPEIKFSSLDDLKEQLAKDEADARSGER